MVYACAWGKYGYVLQKVEFDKMSTVLRAHMSLLGISMTFLESTVEYRMQNTD